MDQEIILYRCTYINHENQSILGYCLKSNCENIPQFCQLCKEKHHQHHGGQLFSFSEIKELLTQISNFINTWSRKLDLEVQHNQQKQHFKNFFHEQQKIILDSQKYLENIEFLQLVEQIPILKKWRVFYYYSRNIKDVEQMIKQLANFDQPTQVRIQSNCQFQPINQIQFSNKMNYQLKKKLNEKEKREFTSNSNSQKIIALPKIHGTQFIDQALFEEKQFDLALIAIEEALQSFSLSNKQCYDLKIQKGKILLILGKEKKTIYWFEQIIQSKSINEQQKLSAMQYKGIALLRSHQKVQALQTFNQILSINSNDIFSLYQKAILLAQDNQLKEALELIDKCLSYQIDFVEAQCNKGIILHKLSMHHEALKCFEIALQYQPHYISPVYYKGISLIKLNKQEEALQCFDTYLKIMPKDYKVLIDKGYLLAHFGDLENAFLCFEKAQQAISNNEIALYNQGIILQMKGEYEKAAVYFANAVIAYPNNIDFWINKAISLQNLEQYQDAIKWYSKFLDQHQNNIPVLLLKGFNLYKIKSYFEAIYCFDKVIEIDSQNIFAKQLICLSLFKQGKIEEAFNLYQLIIQVQIQINLNLGKSLTNEKEFNKAETMTECCKCIEQIENISLHFFIESYYSLSGLKCFFEDISCSNKIDIVQETQFLELMEQAKQLLFRRDSEQRIQKLNQALIIYNEALKIRPKQLQTLLRKGDILFYLKNYEEAILCFDEITQISFQDIDTSTNDVWMQIKLQDLMKFQQKTNYIFYLIGIRQTYLRALLQKSDCYAEIGYYYQSLQCLNDYLNLKKNDETALIKKIYVLQKFHKYEEEIEVINHFLELFPTSFVKILFTKSYALLQLNKHEQVIETCELVLQIIPTSLTAREYIVQALIKQKKFQQAISYCDDIVNSNPLTPSILILKQQALLEEQSEEYAQKYIEQYQKDFESSKFLKALQKRGQLYKEKLENPNRPKLYMLSFQKPYYRRDFRLDPLLYYSVQLIEEKRINEALFCLSFITKIDKDFQNEVMINCVDFALDFFILLLQTLTKIDPTNELKKQFLLFEEQSLTLFKIFNFEEVIEAADYQLFKLNIKEDKKLKIKEILMDSFEDLVLILFQNNLYDQTIEKCDQILFFDSKNLFALYYKGISLKCLERYQEAIDCIDLMLKVDPQDDLAIFQKGKILYLQNDLANALDNCYRALQINPKLSDANALIAEILFALKDYEKAMFHEEKEFQINPSFTFPLRGECLSQVQSQNVDLQFNDRDLIKAEILESNSISNLILKGSMHSDEELSNIQQPIKAIENINQPPYEEENNIQDLLNQGHSLRLQRNYMEARSIYNKVIENNRFEQFYQGYYYQGVLLFGLKFYDEALEQFKLYLDFNPNDKEAEVYAGNTLLEMGKLQDALVHFKNAFTLDQKDLMILQKLITALIQDNKKEEACQYFFEARIIDPNLIEDKQNEWNVIYNQIKEIIISKEKENTENNHK